MQLQFQERSCSFLKQILQEVQNTEQTQELRLPDAMPDVGRILGAWGQVVLRGKEWQRDMVVLSAGMMVWVLYAPEDESAPRVIDSWIPMQMNWDLPEETPEGVLRLEILPRFVDARTVSARKIVVRIGAAALAEAYVDAEASVAQPGQQSQEAALLRKNYPLQLPKEAGEKSFSQEETLALPASAPQPEKLIYYRLTPAVTEQRVLANKVVFRGTGNLHILYESEEGQVHSWDFELPFSQFAELRGSYSQDAQPQVLLCPTGVELELNEEGKLHLKCGIVSQYLIRDLELVEIVEDAYLPGREVNVELRELKLPAVLDVRTENFNAEQTIGTDANVAADVTFLPGFPRIQRIDDRAELTFPGTFQVLYYGDQGKLQSATARWEENRTIPMGIEPEISVKTLMTGEARAELGADMRLICPLSVQMETVMGKPFPMVTGLQLGDVTVPDPDRPSLILCTAGDNGLWEIAKANGSTMEAIRSANNLEEEPLPGQMLLIPVV